jgi:hypothetical protein
MAIILATQEAEIRRILVQGQPTQIVHKNLSQKYPTCTRKRVGEVTQMVEHLPRKCEALNSNPSTLPKKKPQ